MDFVEFPKIPRYSRDCVITEKIDGTNASIFIGSWLNPPGAMVREGDSLCVYSEKSSDFYELKAGSRTRWITPEQDNAGFARWAYAHAQELVDGLGEGHHFGEYWGQGIQRGYGLKEKRFSLFNVHRWADEATRPKCCHIVPVLCDGAFGAATIDMAMHMLQMNGSYASPGFMRPEGIVIYHKAGKYLFKKTLDKDDAGKGYEK